MSVLLLLTALGAWGAPGHEQPGGPGDRQLFEGSGSEL